MASITRTIREQVTNQIRDDVVAGIFPPGQPLRESELAERFGVSRGPIRDAFLQLSQEGFLAYQANRGVTVRQPPEPENREFVMSLRRQIECNVIRRALPRLAELDLTGVVSALADLRVACEGDDVAAVARGDMAFHQALLIAMGGDEFLPVWKLLCSQMLLAYSRLDNYQQLYDEHARILRAIEAGDQQAVVAAIEANIR